MKNQNVKGKNWLKKETRAYRASIYFLAITAVFTSAFSLAFAYMVKYLINSASNGNEKQLLIFSCILIGVLLFKILFQTASSYYSEKVRAKMTVGLRVRTFSKILRSDYANVQAYHSGELMNRLTSDINEVSVYSVAILPALAGMSVQFFGAIVALLTIDPLFTAIYVVCGGIFCGITAFFRKQIKKRQKAVLQADGAVRSFMQESLSSVMTLKAYGAEEKTTDKAQICTDVYFQKRMKRNALNASMHAVFNLLSNFGLIFAVVWCAVSILRYGNTDYGSILSIILLLIQLQHPLTSISSVFPAVYARQASAERLQKIDEFPCETLANSSTNAENTYNQLQAIRLDNVVFHYGREKVLSGVSARVDKGEIVCLTGASGAGKSTLFKLLLNVFSPTSGELYFELQDNKLPIDATKRGLFAYVPQGNFLFSGTIYENLTFFSEETNAQTLKENVKKAIDIACAQFVWDLPDGLETVLGEDGAGLSEGQMQRLAVARAVVSNRPILLLDEATSALDGETEKRLLENIKNLQNKTCLIVTHRPGALEIADKVLNVENGKIA